MTEKDIAQTVTDLFDAVKNNSDASQRAAGMALVTNFLVNQQRIADALSHIPNIIDSGDSMSSPPAIRITEV